MVITPNVKKDAICVRFVLEVALIAMARNVIIVNQMASGTTPLGIAAKEPVPWRGLLL
jgi:uncharacterized membrane protein (DUF373 family)